MGTRARGWCLTLNNYSEAEYEKLINVTCTYIILGKEKGESDTPHLQGYVEFENAKRLETLKTLSPRTHWEARKGTAAQAATYCMKESAYEEKGEISQQGRRNDLEALATSAMQRLPLKQICEENPVTYLKFYKHVQHVRALFSKERTEAPNVFWLWGGTGVGKTRQATETHKTFYIKDGSKWWDHYDNEDAIVIDDFDAQYWPFRDLLRLLDRYPYQGQTKGGYVNINSPNIYITCEFRPERFWIGTELAQINRRITEIRHLTCDTHVTEVVGNTVPPH